MTINDENLKSKMLTMGNAARAASQVLRNTSSNARNGAIRKGANAIIKNQSSILEANEKDMVAARKKGLSGAMLDRLLLTEDRLQAIANSLKMIADMPDMIGEIITTLTPPNGLKIERVRIPIGVIGIIFESRPNVTADAGALCLKSGNAVILRGGSESIHSSIALHDCLTIGLTDENLPANSMQYVTTTDRSAVGEMLSGLNGAIDLIIPRGGKSLVARVEQEARVPVLSHLDGICHTYVDQFSDLNMAREIVINAKMRRTGVCGATETVLIHKAVLATHLQPILKGLMEAGCTVRGDNEICALNNDVAPASNSDWYTEYLDAIISIRVVDSLNDAIVHIANHSSGHTECIITQSVERAEIFLNAVDSAIIMHNASTQFADGGEFGLGAEIGIATGRLHARGPVGAEGLTTYKYKVHGSGQIRS